MCGVIFRPDIEKFGNCYVDAGFSGGQAQSDADNVENFVLRTGYVIMYVGCPVLQYSKLQTEIALSTTEAEYIPLIQAMREVITFMELIE